MQETMTIKEVEEVIKMKLFTFIADYKGGTYISQYVAKTLEEAGSQIGRACGLCRFFYR